MPSILPDLGAEVNLEFRRRSRVKFASNPETPKLQEKCTTKTMENTEVTLDDNEDEIWDKNEEDRMDGNEDNSILEPFDIDPVKIFWYVCFHKTPIFFIYCLIYSEHYEDQPQLLGYFCEQWKEIKPAPVPAIIR